MDTGSPVRLRATVPVGLFAPRPGGNGTAGRGFLGTVAALLVAVVGAVLFVMALVVIATLFVVAISAAVCVVAARGVVHSLSSRSHPRDRPVEPGGFRPASVIESTATVIRRAAPKSRV